MPVPFLDLQEEEEQCTVTMHIATDDAEWETESRDGRMWRRTQFSPDKVAARRERIQSRGQTQ